MVKLAGLGRECESTGRGRQIKQRIVPETASVLWQILPKLLMRLQP